MFPCFALIGVPILKQKMSVTFLMKTELKKVSNGFLS